MTSVFYICRIIILYHDGLRNCLPATLFCHFHAREKNALTLAKIVKRKSSTSNHINHFPFDYIPTQFVLLSFFGVNYVCVQTAVSLLKIASILCISFSVCCMLPFRFSAYFNYDFLAEYSSIQLSTAQNQIYTHTHTYQRHPHLIYYYLEIIQEEQNKSMSSRKIAANKNGLRRTI